MARGESPGGPGRGKGPRNLDSGALEEGAADDDAYSSTQIDDSPLTAEMLQKELRGPDRREELRALSARPRIKMGDAAGESGDSVTPASGATNPVDPRRRHAEDEDPRERGPTVSAWPAGEGTDRAGSDRPVTVLESVRAPMSAPGPTVTERSPARRFPVSEETLLNFTPPARAQEAGSPRPEPGRRGRGAGSARELPAKDAPRASGRLIPPPATTEAVAPARQMRPSSTIEETVELGRMQPPEGLRARPDLLAEVRTASASPFATSSDELVLPSLIDPRTSVLPGLREDPAEPLVVERSGVRSGGTASRASVERASRSTPSVAAADPSSATSSRPPRASSLPDGALAEAEPFGHFLLLGKVGTGGMADVRLACQRGARGFTKPCVIKRITDDLASERDYREMFVEEARISERLQHRNIVRLFEFGEVDEKPYMALELVDGVNLHSLDALAGKEGLPLAVICEIGAAVADALAYAHDATGDAGEALNLVHRDVSPQNILISREGEVKLADFGIARFEGRLHQTGIGPPKGKLRYMAPEVLRYEGLDYRADLFSLGVVLTELLTGRALLPSGVLVIDDLEALIRSRCGSAATRLPSGLVELMIRMTAIAPGGRPRGAAEVSRQLRSVRESLDHRETLGDYAAKEIAPRVPSAESAVRALLNPGEEPPTPAVPAPARGAPRSLGAAPIDLSSTLVSEEDIGFPTTALFALSKELGLVRALPSGPKVPTPWESGAIDETHQSAETAGTPGILDSIIPGNAFAATYQGGRRPAEPLFDDGLLVNPPVPMMNGRPASGIADTHIRIEAAPAMAAPAPAQPGRLRAPVKERRSPVAAAPHVGQETLPMPASPAPVPAPAPAPAPARKRSIAMVIVVVLWLLVVGIGIYLIRRG